LPSTAGLVLFPAACGMILAMDNAKTGALIKAQRKEKGLTQLQLAQRLNITDRAVSKWERGLSAPDIALLEPLGETLGLTVTELIRGERCPEEDIGSVLAYSRLEIAHKVGIARKKYLSALLLVLLGAAICLLLLWRSGVFYRIDRVPSPAGNAEAAVYSRALDGNGFANEQAVSVITRLADGAELRVTYGDCGYGGLWWSPDGSKYVLALEQETGTQLSLAWLERHVESNLNAYLSMGVELTELSKNGCAGGGVFPDIRYEFLQWASDSRSMLICYSFRAADAALHEGYFWYDCHSGQVQAILELEP